jgi:eukaryotic-like serine/threonine-protein kinase
VFGVQRIGRYEVLNHLASGGMGQVYLARATGLGGFERQVVVKTLDLSITDDDDAFVTMFLDEARLVGALNHQFIAPVYEVGCDEEGRYYLVMDYVHGETAEAVFRVSGERMLRMPLAYALTVVSAVASALDYAHGLCAADGTPLDIVHRDVSLSNIMCGHDGAVKLIDFGIAKAANRATKTQVGTLKGKIGYLAPEQIHRRDVDHRADIFALGIVLYELTTGTRAFREVSDLITLERITKGDIRRPSELVSDYPADLERIVMKALSVDPDLRFQTAGAMARDLEKLAARMHLPLGHGAVIEVMGRLFSDHKGRRRLARGSNEVKTDPSLQAIVAEDEKTPITDILQQNDTRTVTVDERFAVRLKGGHDGSGATSRAQRPTIPEPSRAQRPTLPIKGEGARSQRPTVPSRDMPIEDRPTPFADPAAAMRAKHALIPLEDRPTPIADAALRGIVVGEASSEDSAATITTTDASDILPLTSVEPALALPQTPAPLPAPPPRPLTSRPARIPTGPQLPMDQALLADTDISEDAPTVIGGQPPDRDDPTDVKTALVQGEKPFGAAMTALSSPPPPPAIYLRERSLSTAVVARLRKLPVVEATPRNWLLLCGLFVIAVVVACLVALI